MLRLLLDKAFRYNSCTPTRELQEEEMITHNHLCGNILHCVMELNLQTATI